MAVDDGRRVFVVEHILNISHIYLILYVYACVCVCV